MGDVTTTHVEQLLSRYLLTTLNSYQHLHRHPSILHIHHYRVPCFAISTQERFGQHVIEHALHGTA